MSDPAPQEGIDPAARFRWRLIAGCLLLVGLAMVQSPGLLVADTKLDLAVDPGGFLTRALHLWDAEGAFGQLQNQAYGYLWPMGPFFWLGSVLDLPGWVVQRLWIALVMGVAFVGAAALARALGVRRDVPCLIAGFAYALSPRMLTVIGPISIEAWPSAMAPWVLLALVLGSSRGSPWRYAAWAGFAVAMVGGVNAAATAAVLPLGVIWLLTRGPGPRTWRLLVGWPIFTALGTLWWLVPLFVMGAYSPPFLDFIESAAITTFPTTPFDALRGTSNWVPYVEVAHRAGNDLLRYFHLTLNLTVLVVAGLVGMMLRTNPHRLFLALSLAAGMVLVTMGHTGAVEGWYASGTQGLLDGVLAPLRNVHKFDPVIRLPLVLGLAWAVDALLARAREARAGSERLNLQVGVGVVVLAVLVTASPLALGRGTPAGGFAALPDYWSETAEWLEAEQDDGVALLIPGSSFGRYVWGRAQDEPLQSLAGARWAVRNAIPLTPPGNIRMLDAIERRLATGRGSRGLTDYLRRAGVSHLVMRNDLVASRDRAETVLVYQALATSPGIERVASFGPIVGGDAHLVDEQGRRLVVNGGWQAEYAAIDVFAVSSSSPYAITAEEPNVVVGGPEDLLDLLDLGLLGRAPVELAADATDPGGRPWVLTDGNRSVERNFGRLHDGWSPTRLRGDPPSLDAAAPDYQLPTPERWSTFAAHRGIAGVSASGSRSDPSTAGGAQPGAHPFAALDGHAETAWLSTADPEAPPWWEVRFDDALLLDRVTVAAPAEGAPAVQEVVLETDGWVSDPVPLSAGARREIRVPSRMSTRLRVRGAPGQVVLGLSSVEIPGVEARRVLVLPEPPGAVAPAAVVLRAVDDARTGCARVSGTLRCVPDRRWAAEEPLGFARELTLPAGGSYQAALRVRPRPGAALDGLATRNPFMVVTASSVGVATPAGGAVAAVDGDGATTWVAGLEDDRPRLDFSWLVDQRITGLRLDVDDDVAARAPRTVRLTWPDGERLVTLVAGRADFPAIETRQLSIEVTQAEDLASLAFDGSVLPTPVGITELRLEGVDSVPMPTSGRDVALGCGSGPEIVVNGRRLASEVRGSPAQMLAGEELPARVCGEAIGLRTGENEVSVEASSAFTPTSLVLRRASVGGPAASAVVESRSDASRVLVGRPGGVMGTTENANPGWQAHLDDGARLPGVVLDGWRQGWRLPPTEGAAAAPARLPTVSVTMRFAPDGAYRAGLASGLLLLLGLGLGLLLTRQRRHRPLLDPTRPLRGAWAAAVLCVVTGGLVAGTVGAGIAITLLLGALVVSSTSVRPRLEAIGAGLGAAALVLAGTAYLLRPWGDGAGWAGELAWPGYLAVGACLVPLALLAGPERQRPLRLPRFIAGRSTRR